jgi:hypothetical protein
VTGDTWRDVPGTSATGTAGRLSLGAGTAMAALGGRVYVRRGSTWVRAQNPCPIGTSLPAASATSARLFALCGEPAAGSLYVTMSYSDDQARHWTTLPRDDVRGLRLSNGPFVGATAVSSTVLFAASGSRDTGGGVLVSRDAGRTWRAASGTRGLPDLDTAVAGGWRYVGASSGSRIVALPAIPRRSYWVTYDGGVRWAAVTFPAA